MALQCLPADKKSNRDYDDDENNRVHVESVEPLHDNGLDLSKAHEKSRVAKIGRES